MSFFFTPPTDSPDEPQRLRTIWRFLIFGAGFVVCQLVLGIGVAAVWLVWLLARGQLAGPLDPVKLEAMLYESLPALTAASALPSAAMSLGWCALCRRYLDRRPVATMGLVRLEHGVTTGILPGFLFGMAPIALAALGLWGVGAYHFVGLSLPAQALYMAPAFVLLAFQEEIIFRGYLFQNLLDIRRPVTGFVLTSLAFWLVHGFNPAAWSSPFASVNLFGAGVVLAAAYQLSRNIWFPTAMHFAWNFAQGVVFSIPVSGMALEGFVRLERNRAASDMLTGGEFGLEGSVVVTVIEVVMCVVLFALQRTKRSGLTCPSATNSGSYAPTLAEQPSHDRTDAL
jgi:membrane protease YdiL (CAAX protease family)